MTGLRPDLREVLVTTAHEAAPVYRHLLDRESVLAAPAGAWASAGRSSASSSIRSRSRSARCWPSSFSSDGSGPSATRGPPRTTRDRLRSRHPTDGQPGLDVSQLPTVAFDAKTPIWWGNTLFMVIETTTIALLVVSYFYTWQYVRQWPPTQSNLGTSSPNPLPSLGLATLDVALLVASCLPAVWLDRAARKREARHVAWGLAVLVVVGAMAILLRFGEFPGLKFRWDDNAYASIVWAVLVMHLTYLIAAVLEVAVTLLWVVLYGVDEHRAVDVTLTTIYWYWMAGIWVLLYSVVYWAPRIL